MSAIEETKEEGVVSQAVKTGKSGSQFAPVAWLLNLLSSVRFGVTLLILLVVASMIGMLIMQQNVDGFDKYYAELQPSQKLLYGSLGFFDIYHAWYFNALLLILSLNIILASIDRFPKTWKIVSRRKLEAGRLWLQSQQEHAEFVVEAGTQSEVQERVAATMRKFGLKPTVTQKDGRAYVYGERGAWNRMGYLGVHVALLTIFTGGFLTAQFSRDGQMPLQPGGSATEMRNLAFQLDKVAQVPVPLPFTVECTDIQQKLIRKDGSILQNNTIDWLTWIKIKDETGEREALVHLNKPFDYRGYRFFQASFISFGQARHITLKLTPTDGSAPQEITIKRDGSGTLPDGTRIDFVDFQPDFTIGEGGRPDSQSGDYNNPAAVLKVTTPTGEQKTVYAFAMELPSGAPVGAPFGGYKYRLADFEKVPLQHILSINKDPGKIPVYVGFTLLLFTLGAVFFFSHQRVWAMIEEREGGAGSFAVVMGGNSNRNKLGFEDRFKKLVGALGGQTKEVEQS
jgi:cytochrome c biogenesis protein